MGDIADALRRAREQNADGSSVGREAASTPGARAARPTADGAGETGRRGEIAPVLRAARLGSAADTARTRDHAPTHPNVPSDQTGPAAGTSAQKPRKRRSLRQKPSDGSRAERVSLLDPASPAATASRRLAQQVKRQSARRGMASIVVTSPMGGDGKTTVSCNLAVSLARLDRSRSVVLVDLDLRRPRVAESFRLSVDVGLDELLLQEATLDEALIETDEPGLTLLAPRGATSTPEQLLASANLRRLLDALTRRFSMIIIDTPPVLAVADALSVLDVADGCLMVVRAGKSPTSSVEHALEHLPAEKMLGCCLNLARRAQHNEGYYGYGPRLEELAVEGDGLTSGGTPVPNEAIER